MFIRHALWQKHLLRTMFLLLFLWSLNALPKRLVIMGPQRTVETLNPKMGVHSRLTDEVDEWKLKCPLIRFRKFLIEKKIEGEQDLLRIDKEIDEELHKAIEFARTSPFPDPREALDDVYTVYKEGQ